jgi:hypothetical protein
MRKLPSVAAAILFVAFAAACQRGLPVEEPDKAVMLRAADLVPFGYGLTDTQRFETFDKSRYFDGSWEITYEYETPESETEHSMYLNATVGLERTGADAIVSYGALKTAMKYGLKANGVEATERPKFYTYGDASEFYVLEKDGNPIGNLFAVRHGSRVYLLLVSGMYFDDAEVWKEVMHEKLVKFSAYNPKR